MSDIPNLTEEKIEARHRERVAAELEYAGFAPTDTEKLWDIEGAMSRISESLSRDWTLFVEARDGTLQRRLRREAKLARRKDDFDGGSEDDND